MPRFAVYIRNVVLAFFCIVVPWPTYAIADSSASVEVTVLDTPSKLPIVYASVFLIGPRNVSGVTDSAGKVRFDGLPSGQYTVRVTKGGYVAASLRDFDLDPGKEIELTASLSKPSALRTIASITVKASSSISVTSIDQDSAASRVSQSLVDALGLLPGVDLGAPSVGASERASIEGRPFADTGTSLDGIPLAPPGQSSNLRPLDADLFGSLRLDQNTTHGSPGGSLDFSTLNPTISWLGSIAASTGTLGQNLFGFSERGTFGYVGLSYAHSAHTTVGPLQGLTYLDASGIDYSHDDSASTAGDVIKARVPIGSQVVTVTGLSSTSWDSLICRPFGAHLPCGYGPYNSENEHLSTVQVRDALVLGKTSWSFALFSNNERVDVDQSNRLFLGEPFPLEATASILSKGLTLNASLPAGRLHSLGFSAFAITSSGTSAGSGEIMIAPASTALFENIAVSDSISLGDRLQAFVQAGVARNSVTGAPYTQLSATYRPGFNNRFGMSAELGSLNAPTTEISGVSSAQDLQFDCAGNVATGVGPTKPSDRSTSSSLRLYWTHRQRQVQTLISIYRQEQYNASIPLTVAADAIAATNFFPGYFQTVQSVYQSAAGCLTNADLPKSNIFYSVSQVVPTQTYVGGTAALKIALGPSIIAAPYYSVTQASENGGGGYILAPSSTVIPGRQLPNVPFSKEGLVLDGESRSFEALVSFQHVDTNNANNLPAYSTLAAGLALHLKHGTISLLGTNLTNQFTGGFATPKSAVPLNLQSGAHLPTLAVPLPPRTFLVRYRVAIGMAAPPPASVDNENQGVETNFTLEPFPATTPANPYALNTTSENCGPEQAHIAGPILESLRVYVTNLAQGTGADLDANGIRFSRRSNSGQYVVLVGGEPKLIAALFACGIVHGGSAPDVAAWHLYIPTKQESRDFDLVFAPAVGLYVTGEIQETIPTHVQFSPLPTTAPNAPFSINNDSSRCPSNQRPAAQSMLNALNSYFAKPGNIRGATPEPWVIQSHSSGSQEWFELSLPDPALREAILDCAKISSGAISEIRKAGLDAAARPSLNFAWRWGLYVEEGS